MSEIISYEFAIPRPGKASLIGLATLRYESANCDAIQWSVESIEGEAKPEERSSIEVWLREEKWAQIARKFKERIGG
jgi:hypothetical protein